MAVCYLNMAIQVTNMAALVMENQIVISQDDSFSTPLSAGAYSVVCVYI